MDRHTAMTAAAVVLAVIAIAVGGTAIYLQLDDGEESGLPTIHYSVDSIDRSDGSGRPYITVTFRETLPAYTDITITCDGKVLAEVYNIDDGHTYPFILTSTGGFSNSYLLEHILLDVEGYGAVRTN